MMTLSHAPYACQGDITVYFKAHRGKFIVRVQDKFQNKILEFFSEAEARLFLDEFLSGLPDGGRPIKKVYTTAVIRAAHRAKKRKERRLAILAANPGFYETEIYRRYRERLRD